MASVRRRRCAQCRQLKEGGVIRVFDRVYGEETHLDYRPGYHPRGLPSAFWCHECASPTQPAPIERDRMMSRARAEWGDQSV